MAVLEACAQHNEDVAIFLNDTKTNHLLNSFAAFSTALLFASTGTPEAVALAMGGNDHAWLMAASTVEISSHSNAVQISSVVGSMAICLGFTHLRANILEYLDDFDLVKPWQWLETGSISGLMLLVLLAPFIALFLLLMLTTAIIVLGLVLNQIERWNDQRNRYECPQCSCLIRLEASHCKECHQQLQPKLMLSKEKKGFYYPFFLLKKTNNLYLYL